MSKEALYIVEVILVAALCNFCTRALPFALFSKSEKLPDFVQYLGKYLPPCVMAILVVYCFRSISFATMAGFLPMILSAAVVVVLHLWKRNNLISIIGGTALYMFLVQVVFA